MAIPSANLIPRRILAARARKSHLRGWLLGVMLSCAAVVVSFSLNEVSRVRAESLAKQHDELQEQFHEVNRDLRVTSQRVQVVQGRIERANALRRKRAWSKLLMFVGQSLPDEAWLTAIATDPAQPSGRVARGSRGSVLKAAEAGAGKETDKPDTIVIDAPRKLVIKGKAFEHGQLYTFMQHLKEAGVFRSVQLVRSALEKVATPKEQSDLQVVAFELVCEW